MLFQQIAIEWNVFARRHRPTRRRPLTCKLGKIDVVVHKCSRNHSGANVLTSELSMQRTGRLAISAMICGVLLPAAALPHISRLLREKPEAASRRRCPQKFTRQPLDHRPDYMVVRMGQGDAGETTSQGRKAVGLAIMRRRRPEVEPVAPRWNGVEGGIDLSGVHRPASRQRQRPVDGRPAIRAWKSFGRTNRGPDVRRRTLPEVIGGASFLVLANSTQAVPVPKLISPS